MEFVNADAIAQGLSVFAPQEMAISAGRILLGRLRDLAARKENFAFETTLAGRGHGVWLKKLQRKGYEFHLIYLWLPSAEFAIERVSNRIILGGHSVPAQTIRRRYSSGLRNLFRVYLPLAATWRVYDNSKEPEPELIASGAGAEIDLLDPQRWARIERGGRP
jgi:predicted ABC-type ATPase